MEDMTGNINNDRNKNIDSGGEIGLPVNIYVEWEIRFSYRFRPRSWVSTAPWVQELRNPLNVRIDLLINTNIPARFLQATVPRAVRRIGDSVGETWISLLGRFEVPRRRRCWSWTFPCEDDVL